MGDGTMVAVGALAIAIGLVQWLVKGPWDPAEAVTHWLGNRAMVMIRTLIAFVLVGLGLVGFVWGLWRLI